MPDQKLLKLSDAFEHEDHSGMYEWSAVMLNINAGHNQKLMDNCKALRHYALYVAKVKAYSKEMTIDAAVNKAVEEAIREDYLDGFFKKHREGVVNVSLTEFNEAEFIANRQMEAVEEIVIRMIRRGKSDEEIADDTGCSLSRIAELRNDMMAMA